MWFEKMSAIRSFLLLMVVIAFAVPQVSGEPSEQELASLNTWSNWIIVDPIGYKSPDTISITT